MGTRMVGDKRLLKTALSLLGYLILAACSTTQTASLHEDTAEMCASDEVLVCDHGSRIANANRNCICQPERQTLNTEVDQLH